MFTKVVLAAAALAMSATAASAATVFDAAGQGPGGANFEYGYVVDGAFTAYTDANGGGCLIPSAACRNGPTPWLGAYFSDSDHVANTAYLFASDVSLHPGGNGEKAGVAFVAPSAGTYRFSGLFRAVDAPYGNGVRFDTPAESGVLGVKGAANGVYSFDFRQTLGAGERALFAVGDNGSYYFDTTGLKLSVSAVPEPATWAMMLMGFFGLGGVLRSRRGALAAA